MGWSAIEEEESIDMDKDGRLGRQISKQTGLQYRWRDRHMDGRTDE
jgi:hypothetical protein